MLRGGELVDKREVPPLNPGAAAPMVRPDGMAPLRSMADGRIYDYPFDQLGCGRLTAVTPRRARAARRFLDAFGFKREGLVRQGFGDDDAVISGLLKREWEASRWRLPHLAAPGGVEPRRIAP